MASLLADYSRKLENVLILDEKEIIKRCMSQIMNLLDSLRIYLEHKRVVLILQYSSNIWKI